MSTLDNFSLDTKQKVWVLNDNLSGAGYFISKDHRTRGWVLHKYTLASEIRWSSSLKNLDCWITRNVEEVQS